MKKPALIIAGVLASVVVLILVTLAVFNFNDTGLSENVQTVLKTKQEYSDQQKNAYYYMLGLYLRATDPGAEGKKVFEEYLKLPDSQKGAFWKSHFEKQTPWKYEYSGCSNQPTGCTIDWIASHPDDLQVLKEQPESLQRYIELLQFEAAADIYEGTPEQPFSMIQMFSLSLHRKLILQMIQWDLSGQTQKVLDLMEKANRYNQSLMASGTLLDRMVAVVEIKDMASLLKDILRHHPNIKLSKPLMASFEIKPTRDIFLAAMTTEVRFLKVFFESARLSDFELTSEENGSWKRPLLNLVPVGLLLRRHETLNRYYDLVTARLSGTPSQDLMDWLTQPRLYQYLENPLGRKLVAVFTEQLEGRMRRFDLHKKEIEKAHEIFLKAESR